MGIDTLANDCCSSEVVTIQSTYQVVLEKILRNKISHLPCAGRCLLMVLGTVKCCKRSVKPHIWRIWMNNTSFMLKMGKSNESHLKSPKLYPTPYRIPWIWVVQFCSVQTSETGVYLLYIVASRCSNVPTDTEWPPRASVRANHLETGDGTAKFEGEKEGKSSINLGKL